MVLHTSVYTDFKRVRFRIVASPQTAIAGAVVVPLPDLTRLAGQPAALVAHLANPGETARQVRVAAGGEVLGEALVPAGGEIVRVDLNVSDGADLADSGERVELTALPPGDWSLNYLEVANVHGFSTGLFEFNITPAVAGTPQRLGALASVPAFCMLAALYGLRWQRIAHPRGRVVHAALALLAASFLVAVFVAPVVSDFAIHLAPHTLLVCVAMLYYPALAVVARDFRPRLQCALEAAGVQLRRAAGWVWAGVWAGVWAMRHHGTRAARWTWATTVMVYGTAQAAGVTLGQAVMRGAATAWAGRYHVQRAARWSSSALNRATRMPAENTLHLFALAALAVAQPLFDVVSREPAFFVARNTTAGQLAGLVAILGVGLPLGLVAIEAIFARVHEDAGKVVHAGVVTVLGIMTLLPVLKRLSGMDAVPLIAVSALLAALVAFGVHYSRVVRMFLTAMSPAAVVVPVLFLVNPDIREAVVVADRAGNPAEVERAAPIVFVVLDELPTRYSVTG